MNARNKKSKNASYKNRKNKASGHAGGDGSQDTLPGLVEKEMVMAVRRDIKRGKEDLIKDAYGMAGLEDYLVGGQFEKLADENYYETGRKYYQKSCEKGHPLGQFAVALMYLQGSMGQSVDESLGVEMMSRAAKAGCGPALYNKGKWLLDGTFQQPKDAKKANKLFHRAIKDPVMAEFPQQMARTLVSLARLRMDGEGCTKSYSKALGHFRAAEEVEPSEFTKTAIKQLELLESIGGCELQREADTRNRRLKVLARAVQYQSLGNWVAMYKHCGFELSVQPGVEEAGVSLDQGGMVEWMERAGAVQTLPEEYPGMHDPLPSLECTGCLVTEDTLGEKMKKCTDCQAPYCGAACQRKDWKKHKPVCEAVQGSMGDDLTHHELELLKQDENLAERLSKLGISMEEFDNVASTLKECGHGESSIPCSTECLHEKGAGSMNKHGYTLVGQSVLTERQRQNARDLGHELPQEMVEAAAGPPRDEERNLAADIAQGAASGPNNSKPLRKQLAKLEENPDFTYCLFTPGNEAADRGIQLTNVMGQLMFNLMWNRLIAVPWGAAAGSRPLWLVYDMLQASCGSTKYKNMLRNQLMAEFGADPLECKNAKFEEFKVDEVSEQLNAL